MSEPFQDAHREQQEAAAHRFAEHAAERHQKIAAIQQPGGIALVNSAQLVARRLDRVSRYLAGEQLPSSPGQVPSAAPEQVIEAALERAATSADSAVGPVADVAASAAQEVTPALTPETAETAGAPGASEEAAATVLEKIINTPDFVGIRYLEAGVAAGRAVCRIDIRDELGRTVGYGTGSLVSPRLLLTNHHVLPSAEVARLSAAEFNYQDGIDGRPLPPQLFGLDPASFFLADQERDFALVAVAAGEQALAPFGLNRLIEALGKALVGEFVTIVQHPRGEKKQVALRENKIVDELEFFLHYEADTEPGSSGSPVFNDQWEIVALHHASVAAPDRKELGGFMNEGIRASRILKFVREQPHGAAAQALVDRLFSPERVLLAAPVADTAAPARNGGSIPGLQVKSEAASQLPSVSGGAVRVSVPLEISIGLGRPQVGGNSSAAFERPAEDAGALGQEAIRIDPDYGSRRGYDDAFLGNGNARVPLPTLSEELRERAATRAAGGPDDYVLPYHHFSVVIDKERRLAFFTAVNIDGATSLRLRREADRWSLDPRIPPEQQTGEAVYVDNDLDRGHLVRRLDPAWGRTRTTAKRANDDTFHFTNCTPQHKNFNQNRTTWAGLEDYILDNADNLNFRASIFTGPIFAADDEDYRGVKLPRQFWKVAVMRKRQGRLSATGYLLSQAALLQGLEAAAEFSYGAYRTYQVPVARIEQLTGLSFGPLIAADPLAGLEADLSEREIRRYDDLVL